MQVKLTVCYLYATGYVMFYLCRLVGLKLDQVCQHRFDNKVLIRWALLVERPWEWDCYKLLVIMSPENCLLHIFAHPPVFNCSQFLHTTRDQIRCYEVWGKNREKWEDCMGVAGSRIQDTSGLSRQWSATEPRKPDNYQPSQCLAVVAQWQSTGGSNQRCPWFNSWQLPAFSLSSIFT